LTPPSSRPRPASSLITETTIANHTRSVPTDAATPARNRGRGPQTQPPNAKPPGKRKTPAGRLTKTNKMPR
jgi:hypothetical protein